jgi:hypothetical protein
MRVFFSHSHQHKILLEPYRQSLNELVFIKCLEEYFSAGHFVHGLVLRIVKFECFGLVSSEEVQICEKSAVSITQLFQFLWLALHYRDYHPTTCPIQYLL